MPPDAPSPAAGLVFNIMRYSLRDGPGIRTTVFLKGCPLRCRWCHNPESQSARPVLMLFEERCRRCGDCVAVCPHRDGDSFGAPEQCEVCGACVEACLSEARQVAGRWMTAAAVLAEIERDAVFFDESGGGVTISGGEPLSQPGFTVALLDACRARRIHTALDTCGMAPVVTLLRAAGRADLVLFDLKLMDNSRHEEYTGAPNAVILDNLKALLNAGRQVIVRYPLIPGINDGDGQVAALADFLRPLGALRVDLLPYHRAGVGKYKRLGIPCLVEGVAAPVPERVEAIAAALRRAGLDARTGGSS